MKTAIWIASAVAFALLSRPCCAADRRYGLSVRPDGVLIRDGKPFRGIGVNFFDAFYRKLKNADDSSYEADFRALQTAGIPFVRMMGCGFWPVDQKLYQGNKVEFFRRFDAVVRAAEKYHVGLIPSLFWNEPTVPDLVGEPVSAWGDAGSKTQAYMRDYVRDVVTRYRNSPAIWGWEFGNEFNLGANLPNAAEHRPAIVPSLGTPTSRSSKDDWTFDIIRAAFIAFGREVRKYDSYHIISTGDSLPRPSSWHQWKENNWTADSPVQWDEMLADDTPNPADVISVHVYSQDDRGRLDDAAAVARRIKKPLFVGEFGAEGNSPQTRQEFMDLLEAIEKAKAPLACLWVYALGDQDKSFNVTASNSRAYQLRAIDEANSRILHETGVGRAKPKSPSPGGNR